MVKGIICFVLFFEAAIGMAGVPEALFGSAPRPTPIPSLWSKKMIGAISGVSLSKDGKVILVATNPDKDIEGSSDSYFLTQYDSQGRIRWQKKMKSAVKEQDVSNGGALAVISNYENEIVALDSKGEVLWSAEGLCRPYVLNTSKAILCYHDDDAEPNIGFDVYDWKGNKTFSYPIQRDILAFKLSQDDRNLALALTQGEISLLGSKNHPSWQKVWQKKVKGEVVDLAVSSGERPWVAVLSKEKKKQQTITVFDHGGSLIGSVSPAFHAIQLEFEPQGKALFYYGNGADGQFLASLSLPTLKETWRQGTKHSSDYSYSISVAKNLVFMGIEEIDAKFRKSHLLAFDLGGTPKWDLPLRPLNEEAYLYTHRSALGASLLVIGTDDAQLGAYRLETAP